MALKADAKIADPVRQPTCSVRAQRLPGNKLELCQLIVETPVAIVVQGTSVAVMMASPADLEDFAVGFALTEGFITSLADIVDLEVVDHELGIEARLWLKDDKAEAFIKRRRSMAGPVGCGLCGIDSLDEATRSIPRVDSKVSDLSADEINSATELLRNHQPFHDETHAAHSAGFLLPGSGIVAAREDVGRHNALDKLIGSLILEKAPIESGAIVLTSRVSVELVQKAALVGCPILIAVSAPTSLALETAQKAGITLIAHSRGDGFTVFTHPQRLPHHEADRT
ncbi:MAG: formate dehydrogenase accessory sulfurtransferase FdhD [Pseudomonadota bacterium]